MTIDRSPWFVFALLAILVAVIPDRAEAQGTGRIVGRVLDGAHGTPIAGAQVLIAGTTIGTTAAIDGRYTLSPVPAGTVEIRVRRIGYGPKAIEGITVRSGAAVEQNVTLTEEVLQLEAITVTASAERGTVSRALEEQRNAPIIMSAATQEQIARSPDSDAGQAVRRVSGVTVQDDKYVFVRGLGERYTTTSLNSARIPSPEPERKVVPLDLFPSSLLEAITTSKTFTPEQPGDFSGAQVNLKTREFPLGRKISFSTGVGYNDAATGKTILRAPTVGREWLGFAGAARQIPGSLASLTSLSGQSLTQLNNIMASFRNVWSAGTASGRPNTSMGLSVGGEDPIAGQRVGYLGSLTYSLSEDVHQHERRALAVADGLGGTRPENEYLGSTATSGVLWGGLLNLSTRVGSSTKLSINNAYTRSADNQASRFAGSNEEFGRTFDITRLTFTEREVRSNQFVGEQLLGGRHTLDWSFTTSGVRRYEPDRSDLVYETSIDAAGVSHPMEWFGGPRSATRTFSDLTENALEGSANFKIQLGGSQSSLKFGALGRGADRDADTRAYDIVNYALTDTERSLSAETVLSSNNAMASKLFLVPSANAGFYTAADRLVAGYAQFDIAFTSRLRVVGGARIEHAHLTVDSRGSQGALSRALLNNTDVLPSVALTMQLTRNQNLRLSATQTLSRPEYRELSAVAYADILGGLTVAGNPDLKRALIQNLDLRWEIYPGANEVMSLGLFAKHFSQPIEKVLVGSTGAPTLNFINAEGANNFGAEAELRKNLGALSNALRGFSVTTNATVMRSRIETGPGNSFTNPDRSMVGQSGYVVNAGLGYINPRGRINTTVLYNIVGRRIVEGGLLPRPDSYEEARHVLDASLELPFIARGTLKLDAKNLLDAPYRTTQGSVIRSEYHAGRSFSMGLSWTL